jgi:hypothetical protein
MNLFILSVLSVISTARIVEIKDTKKKKKHWLGVNSCDSVLTIKQDE